MTDAIWLLPCPRCSNPDGQIIADGSLGYYTRCHACGLQLSGHCLTEKAAAVEWDNLAKKLCQCQRVAGNTMNCLYAGLDRDAIVKVFMKGPGGSNRHVGHQQWLDILAVCVPGIRTGDMPIISLHMGKG